MWSMFPISPAKFVVPAFMLSAVGGMLSTQPAKADQSAATFLQPYVQWVQQKDPSGGNRGLKITIVSNRPSTGAYYAENVNSTHLTYYYYYNLRDFGFSGEAVQYFNDRRWSIHPFNPNATDKLGVNLDALHGNVTLTLESWGYGKMFADLHAANGVLIGTFAGVDPITAVISVQRDVIPLIH